MEAVDRDMLTALTADIVGAHVSSNTVSADQVPELISNVYGALAGLGKPSAQDEEKERPEPAVSIRASVRRDIMTCLDCGKKMKMLKRHLMTSYKMTPEEYRKRWGLSADYPMVAPNYAKKRSTLAKKIGLGRKPGVKRKTK